MFDISLEGCSSDYGVIITCFIKALNGFVKDLQNLDLSKEVCILTNKFNLCFTVKF